MKAGIKHIRSWVTVLSLFLAVVLVCVLWKRFTSPSTHPAKVQLIDDPGPALERVRDSVVGLWAVRTKHRDSQAGLIGCALIVDSRGYALTSAELTDDIQYLHAIDYRDTKYDASVVTTDEKSRLTLLKLDPGDTQESEGFAPAELGDSEQVAEGEGVIALGGRMTPSSWKLTTKGGTITRESQSLVVEKRKYRDLIQTDISLTNENVGGPLIDSQGEVIGFALPFVQPPNSPSFSYAVPSNRGRDFLRRLPIPRWTRGPSGEVCNWLGAEMLPLNPVMATHLSIPQRHGEIVNHIRNNSPVDRAGLRRGDVITGIDGDNITDRPSFDDMVPRLCKIEKIKLRILREGREKNLTVQWDDPGYVAPRGGSLVEVVLVVLIFTLMYYCVYRNIFDRVVLFVLGAMAVAVTGYHLGFYSQARIASALVSKIDVLCFIVGMQLITGVLEDAGALEYLAKKITLATGGNTWRIMWLFCLITYAFSLVVNNLTTIMLMAPMVLKLSKYLDCDPKPFLTSMIIASNLGGASTMVGDFPNMLIGAEIGLPFHQFVSYMLPICLLELFVLLVYLRIARGSLFKSGTRVSLQSSDPTEYREPELSYTGLRAPDQGALPLFDTIRDTLPKAIRNRKALTRGLVILMGVVVGFLLSDSLGCPPAIVALVGGVVALVLGACEPFSLLQKVSIRDILFFSGLFVLAGAAEASGTLGYISQIIVGLSFGNLLVLCLLLMWTAALVTCFLNAGPTTALFLPVILSFNSAAPHNLYWWSLSLGVCAGSSGTLAGATAGGITATMIDKFMKRERRDTMVSPPPPDRDDGRYGKLTFREYARLGFPVMLIFLLISSVYIALIYRW